MLTNDDEVCIPSFLSILLAAPTKKMQIIVKLKKGITMTFFNCRECQCNPFRGLHHEMLKNPSMPNGHATIYYPPNKCHPHLIGGTVAVCKGFASIENMPALPFRRRPK